MFYHTPTSADGPADLLEKVQRIGSKKGFATELQNITAQVHERADAMIFGSGTEPLGAFEYKWHQVGKRARNRLIGQQSLVVEDQRRRIANLQAKLAEEDRLLGLRIQARKLASNRLGASLGNRWDKLRTAHSAGRLGAKARLAALQRLSLPLEERLLRVVSGKPEKVTKKVQAKLDQAKEIAQTLQQILQASLQENRVTISREDAMQITTAKAKQAILQGAFSGDPTKFNTNWPQLFTGKNALDEAEQAHLMTWCESHVIPTNMREAYRKLQDKRDKLLSKGPIRNAIERALLVEVRDKLQEGSKTLSSLNLNLTRSGETAWQNQLAKLYRTNPRLAFMVCFTAHKIAEGTGVEPVLRILLEGVQYGDLDKKLNQVNTGSTIALSEAEKTILASYNQERNRIMTELGKIDRTTLNSSSTLSIANRIVLTNHADRIDTDRPLGEIAFSLIANGLIPPTVPTDKRYPSALFAAAKLKQPGENKNGAYWKIDIDRSFMSNIANK